MMPATALSKAPSAFMLVAAFPVDELLDGDEEVLEEPPPMLEPLVMLPMLESVEEAAPIPEDVPEDVDEPEYWELEPTEDP
ncbi:hypothetical protein LshimejAT787_1701920 [Lyophyllum shimeji]|uniref:Uncharacterized protein n=1 Tax=Lyophyllum shimeji TaxID=47721 RepID=A0A9P3PX01_LYOSH|nr:hypothetical protein LshimejAT787_1701920 [Lyophyllum shimeji]